MMSRFEPEMFFRILKNIFSSKKKKKVSLFLAKKRSREPQNPSSSGSLSESLKVLEMKFGKLEFSIIVLSNCD